MTDQAPSAGQHGTNLSLIQGLIRLLLELGMLGCLAFFGYNLSETTLVRLLLAILLPVIAMALWTIFRTLGDESAGKDGMVPTPGWIRFLMEISLFLIAAAGAWWAGSRIAAETLLTFTALHYLVTWQRVRWLLTGK
ncbi:MAG: YrdB family protein [Thermomicrobiales bacterium]|nr:YrdB family protein [Thermomicrobiales bacterium]